MVAQDLLGVSVVQKGAVAPHKNSVNDMTCPHGLCDRKLDCNYTVITYLWLSVRCFTAGWLSSYNSGFSPNCISGFCSFWNLYLEDVARSLFSSQHRYLSETRFSSCQNPR
jgi:hypothetical protein